jgi:uncharacterized membrane protein YebE (DUF533 family)
MSRASIELQKAVEFALSSGQACSEPMTPAAAPVNDTLAQNVFDLATADGIVDADERVQLQRFAGEATLSPASHTAMQRALSLPSVSRDATRRSAQAQTGADVIRQIPNAQGGLLGTLLILDAIFGR